MLGWIIGLPVPLLLAFAPSWTWIVVANLLLGLNQGLCWSTAVIMKIDLAGPKQRGLAMGLNEAAGYGAVALMAYATARIAESWGLRPWPFLLGFALVLAGLLITVLFVRETRSHAALEGAGGGISSREALRRGSWSDPVLSTLSWIGMVNNLNDGLAWGLLPLFYASKGLDLAQIGLLAALYPAVWGVAQLGTGWLSDHTGRKPLIAWGMILQGASLAALPWLQGMAAFAGAAALLGLGTAMVYPTLLAAVADGAAPSWRPVAVGVYRLWRDGGYVVGALLAGIVADAMGLGAAILAVAGLTAAAGCSVRSGCASLPEEMDMTWIEKDKALHREIKTPDYVTAFSLVAALTPLAEKAGHHPDLELGWGYVRIKLTTHDAGGVTDKDHALAKAIDQLAVKFGLQ